jgi:hypothetical protein
VRFVLAWVAVVTAASTAEAEDRRVVAARAAYEAQDQQRTLSLLALLLAGTTLDDHDRAAALRLAGCAHMVLEDRAAAIAAFRASFALEPDAALEPPLAASIDARSLFEVARGEWRAALVNEMEDHAAEIAQLTLAVHAPSHARGGQPIEISLEIDGPVYLLSRAELSYRRRGQSAFTLLSYRLTPPISPARFAIPAEATGSASPFVLEYHVTLRHPTGFDLRREGDADHPRLIVIAAGHPPRWYESWWVRGAFALGVIGVGASGYLLYRSIDVGPQPVVLR